MAGREPRCLGLRKCVPFALTQVREQDLSVVIHTLAQEFQIYREVGGEPVPVAKDDSSNGFPRAQHGKVCPPTPRFRWDLSPQEGLFFRRAGMGVSQCVRWNRYTQALP